VGWQKVNHIFVHPSQHTVEEWKANNIVEILFLISVLGHGGPKITKTANEARVLDVSRYGNGSPVCWQSTQSVNSTCESRECCRETCGVVQRVLGKDIDGREEQGT
jgi:hypothetical protein